MNIPFFRFSLMLMLISSPVIASAASLWSGAARVVSVQVQSRGEFIINLEAASESTQADQEKTEENCSLTEGTRSFLVYPQQHNVTINGAKALLSTAMIAFSTANKLDIRYAQADGYCWVEQILLSK